MANVGEILVPITVDAEVLEEMAALSERLNALDQRLGEAQMMIAQSMDDIAKTLFALHTRLEKIEHYVAGRKARETLRR